MQPDIHAQGSPKPATFAALLEVLHAAYWTVGTMSARGYVVRLPDAQKRASRERAFLDFTARASR
jgi:hypothetical protein